MAVSGSWDYTITRDNLIARALRLIGAYDYNETPVATEVTQAAEALEEVVKELHNEGIWLWSSELKQFTLTASDEVDGTDGNVYTCIKDHTSAVGNRPVTGADYSTYWRERGSTGGTWTDATAYHNIGQFTPDAETLFIADCFMRRDNTDHYVEIISRKDYAEIPDKSTTGMPTCVLYDPLLSPEAYFWPIPTVTSDVFHCRQYIKLQDFDAASNNPDAPSGMFAALAWLLAADLASEYSLPLNERIYFDRKAREKLQKAKEMNREPDTKVLVKPCYSR
jgi:hypothetical protein